MGKSQLPSAWRCHSGTGIRTAFCIAAHPGRPDWYSSMPVTETVYRHETIRPAFAKGATVPNRIPKTRAATRNQSELSSGQCK